MAITYEVLRQINPHGNVQIMTALIDPFVRWLDEYDINTLFRCAHFLGQAAHETDGFHTLEEYASGQEYEGAARLGNDQPGDGRLYKGRGIFQLTGRANYRDYGQRLEVDLIAQPTLAASPELSVRVACLFWNDHGCNPLADADDCESITHKINGGYNGLSSRKIYVNRAKLALNAIS